ncbi:MAG TPA: hypothetical protein VFA46_05955 [Actinomycetes bacterium]|nr:hypothetical protein [Actinomycetes bacterium]
MDRTIPGDSPISPEALQAIGELLQAAAQHGLGVAFEPDDEGWRISYILYDWPAYQEYDLPSGPLSNAYDLHIAAAAALKPLIEMGERAERFFAHRDAAKGTPENRRGPSLRGVDS